MHRILITLFIHLALCLSLPSFAAETGDVKSRWISAISNDNTHQLNKLLQVSAGERLWETTASNGKTALMVACKVGDEALAKQLVTMGADIREKTLTHGTAFMFAVLGDQQPLAAWLLALGADIDARGSNGWTSVMIASAKGLDSTLEWLLKQGADAHEPDVYGFTPLMRAADNNHVEAVRLLLNSTEVDVDWQDELANTALHYAVSIANEGIVDQLLDAGADASLSNEAGLTPLQLAMQAVDAREANKAKAVIAQSIVDLLETAVRQQ